MVSVSNGWLSCAGCPKSAEVVGPENNSSASFWLTVLCTLGSIVGVPLLKLVMESYLKRKFSHQVGDLPDALITQAILDKLWIGICSLVTRRQYKEYVDVVNDHLVPRLNLNHEQWGRSTGYRLNVMRAVAKATQQELVPCSNSIYRFFRGFCCSEATPGQIENKAQDIAYRANQLMQNVGLFAHPLPVIPAYQPPTYHAGMAID